MDVLVALGTSVAYFSSLILAVFMSQANALNFESSMVIITLVVMGKQKTKPNFLLFLQLDVQFFPDELCH